jgi:hypothetical protein
LLVPLLAFAQHAPPAQPFQRLDGCIYKPQRWNDGDSFHVILPDRKEVCRKSLTLNCHGLLLPRHFAWIA